MRMMVIIVLCQTTSTDFVFEGRERKRAHLHLLLSEDNVTQQESLYDWTVQWTIVNWIRDDIKYCEWIYVCDNQASTWGPHNKNHNDPENRKHYVMGITHDATLTTFGNNTLPTSVMHSIVASHADYGQHETWCNCNWKQRLTTSCKLDHHDGRHTIKHHI